MSQQRAELTACISLHLSLLRISLLFHEAERLLPGIDEQCQRSEVLGSATQLLRPQQRLRTGVRHDSWLKAFVLAQSGKDDSILLF